MAMLCGDEFLTLVNENWGEHRLLACRSFFDLPMEGGTVADLGGGGGGGGGGVWGPLCPPPPPPSDAQIGGIVNDEEKRMTSISTSIVWTKKATAMMMDDLLDIVSLILSWSQCL